MKSLKLNVTVVGLGLIGGSLVKALRQFHLGKIYGIDVNYDVINDALSEGLIDKGSDHFTSDMEDTDLFILSIYPRDEIRFLKTNIGRMKKGSIVTDTTGLKEKFQEQIENICSSKVDYVGGHPMVGKETNSFKYASVDMLQGGNYILTPGTSSKAESINLLKDLIDKMGFKNIEVVDSKRHDKIITYTSHLPHVIAVAMMDNELSKECQNFSGGSYRDVTRVANINENLWSGLFIDNKSNLISEIDELTKSLEKIKKMLEIDDEEQLKGLLIQSKNRKVL